jgi:hypothetical protein
MKPLLVQLGGHDTHDETARQRGYVVKVLMPLHRMLAVAAFKANKTPVYSHTNSRSRNKFDNCSTGKYDRI